MTARTRTRPPARAGAARPRPQPRQPPFDPAPRHGLTARDFRLISANGFGDGHNGFPHSTAWFGGRLYVGTTRSNLQAVKIQKIFQTLPVYRWPVEGPDDVDGLYSLDRHAQIWRYDPERDHWEMTFRAPHVIGANGEPVSREFGYRSMVVFQGAGDDAPALYTATFAPGRAPGSLILRSTDGDTFDPVTDYNIIPKANILATRILVRFKDRLFTTPTGTRGDGHIFARLAVNVSGMPLIFETRDPGAADWVPVCEPGFGRPRNEGIFMVAPFNDQLYAGTINCDGFELWRSDCEGPPPYRWTQVIEKGAYRGPLNQAVTSMAAFDGALYLGTGIQNGGYDRVNDIGPAASEVVRVHPDDSWDLIAGTPRDTPVGRKEPLSGLQPGFGNLFNGYIWAMAVHDGWLYVGTMDSSIWLQWLRRDAYPDSARRLVEGVGNETILANEAGCDLWRTADGENWLPVTKVGFGNRYNLGVRNLVSTPYGLFVAMANPFGPRISVERDADWDYVDNPRGGLEIWLGTREPRGGGSAAERSGA